MLRRSLLAVVLCSLTFTSLAAPGGPGPAGRAPAPAHHPAPGPSPHGPGPGHSGLPGHARELWIGSALYFVAAGSYYLWNAERRSYVVVEPPPVVQGNALSSYEVIAYPAQGQSAEQQGRDRYECHSWAVGQSGFDPASATRPASASATELYRRALGACLAGRGYSVN